MILNSKFKDYYDYLVHRYGRDPLIVLNRDIYTDILPNNSNLIFTDEYVSASNAFKLYDRNYTNDYYINRNGFRLVSDLTVNIKVECISLAVMGRIYTLIQISNSDKSEFAPDSIISPYHVLSENELCTVDKYGSIKPLNNFFNGYQNDNLLEVHKHLKSPIFLFKTSMYDDKTVYIVKSTPNLSKLGFSRILPPEEIYQQLQCFIGQHLNNVTSEPPITISDKDKIVSKGFDLKTSFRGANK